MARKIPASRPVHPRGDGAPGALPRLNIAQEVLSGQNEDRPHPFVEPRDILYGIGHIALDGIVETARHEHDMAAAAALREILDRVIAGLAKTARVKETDQRLVGREVITAGRAGTGLEAVADVGFGLFCQSAHERRLPCAGLAEKPYHWQRGVRNRFGCHVSPAFLKPFRRRSSDRPAATPGPEEASTR